MISKIDIKIKMLAAFLALLGLFLAQVCEVQGDPASVRPGCYHVADIPPR